MPKYRDVDEGSGDLIIEFQIEIIEPTIIYKWLDQQSEDSRKNITKLFGSSVIEN